MPDASRPHAPCDAGPPGLPAAADSTDSGGGRLRYLFRHSLASGRVNPLLHLVALHLAQAPT